MSWSARGTNSTKSRIQMIEKRTLETTIPSLDELFSTNIKENNPKLARELVEQIYYSSFPVRDASATISTLSMNKCNISELRNYGTLGVIIEMLERINLNSHQSGNHITDLIRSIFILTEDDDSRQRLLHHPRAVSDLLKLLKNCDGMNQEKILQIIEKLCLTSDGIGIFLANNLYSVLLSYELLIRPSTLLHVRYQTANLINKITTNYDASQFPIYLFQDVIMCDEDCAIVDGYIEVQLLNSFHSYLNHISNENIPLPFCSSLMVHLINQVKNETFVDLEHLVLIIKCLMIISKDPHHCDFLLKHSLGVSLQYIVRTDFELYRRVFDPTRAPKQRKHASSSSFPSPSSSSACGSLASSSSSRSLSSSGSNRSNRGFNSPSSKKGNYTVNLVRDSIHHVISTKSIEDINFKMTRLVILIYENVLKLGIHVIGDIVSSGLISGLLFRVGKGENIDKRFFKLVNHFIYLLLIKLTLTQDSSERSMAVCDLAPPESYSRPGTNSLLDYDDLNSSLPSPGNGSKRSSTSSSTANTTQITNKLLKEKNEPVTIRTVTNKLHVQGVTELLITSLDSEEYDVIGDTLISLASMHFQTIKSLILTERVLGKITGYAQTRRDCFYPGLALTADAINSSPQDYFPGFINVMVCDFNAISLLIKAMKLSGWVFNQKGAIYDALAVLTIHPKFRDKLRKCRGINITIYEMDSRKKQRTARRLIEYDVPEDTSTDLLFGVLKKDWAATKIQAVYRAFVARKRGYTSGGLLKIFFGSIGGK